MIAPQRDLNRVTRGKCPHGSCLAVIAPRSIAQLAFVVPSPAEHRASCSQRARELGTNCNVDRITHTRHARSRITARRAAVTQLARIVVAPAVNVSIRNDGAKVRCVASDDTNVRDARDASGPVVVPGVSPAVDVAVVTKGAAFGRTEGECSSAGIRGTRNRHGPCDRRAMDWVSCIGVSARTRDRYEGESNDRKGPSATHARNDIARLETAAWWW